MLPDNITLKNLAAVDHVFASTQAFPSGRLDTSTDLSDPTVLFIRYNPQGKGDERVHRNNIQFLDTKSDVAGKPKRLTSSLTVVRPDGTVYSAVDVQEQLTYMVRLLTGNTTITVDLEFVKSLMRGES